MHPLNRAFKNLIFKNYAFNNQAFKTLSLILLMVVSVNISPVNAAEKPAFSSAVYGLVSAKKSQQLNDELLAGSQHSAHQRNYIPREALLGFKTVINSGGLLTSFPMSKSLADLYLSEVDNVLAEKKNITFLAEMKPEAEVKPDAAVITMVSLVPTPDDKTWMEVTVLVFDWKKANSLKMEPMRAIRDSAIWHSVNRTLLPISAKGIDDWGDRPEIKTAFIEQLKAGTQLFMAPF